VPRDNRIVSLLAAVAGTISAGVICFALFHTTEIVAALVFMLWTLVVGSFGKRPEAIIASFTAALCLDYLFIPPIYKISVGSASGWISLFVFLAASLFAASLSSELRGQRDELAQRQAESERLHALSRALLLSNRSDDMRRLLVNKCMELFDLDEAVLFECANGEYWRSSSSGAIALDDLRRVATYAAAESLPNGAHIFPVMLGNKTFGSLGYCGKKLSQTATNSLSNTLATGLAQAQAHEASSYAEAVRRSEELKSVMIDALAHDLKTPLTTIEMAAETMIHAPFISPDQRSSLVKEIWQASQALRQLIHGAIHLARIDGKRLRLETRPTPVEEAIRATIESVADRASSHQFAVEVEDQLPAVLADTELLGQALKQLVDNAIKYSPPESLVTMSAGLYEHQILISVRDQGPGLTELEQSRVFEKFYRGRYDGSAIQGTGMGLAIAKEIAEAHGGSVSVESQLGQGTRFTISLPAAASSAAKMEQPA
jgi:two-component system sensor histidine kinase KdpD